MANSKKTPSKKPAGKATKRASTITPEERNEMIAEAAFYLAEQREHGGGCQLHDWLEAEAKIDRIYGKAK